MSDASRPPETIDVLPGLTLKRDHRYGGWTSIVDGVGYMLNGDGCDGTSGMFRVEINIGDDYNARCKLAFCGDSGHFATIDEAVAHMRTILGKLAGSLSQVFFTPGA